MYRFHACSGHETASYYAFFSGRWVGSCLAPFHACSGHETAPYHAAFSDRRVRSCLAPFHACSKVLRQHRVMPSSQAFGNETAPPCLALRPSWITHLHFRPRDSVQAPFHAYISGFQGSTLSSIIAPTSNRPCDSTVSCLALRSSVMRQHRFMPSSQAVMDHPYSFQATRQHRFRGQPVFASLFSTP